METPPLRKLLEPERISALLANFALMFSGSPQIWLVDMGGQMVAYHPVRAQEIDEKLLHLTVDQVRQFGRLTAVPLGVAAPVRARGQVVGALVVETLKPNETAAFRFVARVLSLLVENSLSQKELLKETLDRYREINLLYQVGERIAASLDLGEVNRLILDESTRLIKADEGALMLIERASGQLTVWASSGLDAVEDIGPGIPPGHELAEEVVRSGQAQIVEGAESGRRKKPLTAVLCVPLKTKDEVLGVISLAHTHPDRTFRANDVKLLNALAGQAAVAIDHARMFGDLSTLHTELEEANRRLLELDRLKSSFLGVVTHELRSPFANIDFSLQLIERYGTSRWLPEQQEQLVQLARFIKEAYVMIDSLVSFASLLSKQGELFLVKIDFPTLVDKVVKNMGQMARYRQVEVLVQAGAKIPPLRADETRLSEAMHHLVHNAIKFNRPGGTVRIRYWSKGQQVIFEVQDTGVGIPADKLKSLWDPFSQMADPLKRGVEGLGLGLALVKYVIHAHGGRVRGASQVGVGSTFRFWVPLAGP